VYEVAVVLLREPKTKEAQIHPTLHRASTRGFRLDSKNNHVSSINDWKETYLECSLDTLVLGFVQVYKKIEKRNLFARIVFDSVVAVTTTAAWNGGKNETTIL
jgi:hypothetical protein